MEHERGVAVRAADGAAHPRQLVVQRAGPHAGRRRDVCAEDPDADPPEAPERPEAVAVLLGELHGRSPVSLNAEVRGAQAPRAPAGHEGDGDIGHGAGAGLELVDRLAGREPADVDSGDADAGRDPVR